MKLWLIGISIFIELASSLGPLGVGTTSARAADLGGLESIFVANFDTFYRPRFCGQNIARLIDDAANRQIDLTGAYVLKIEGAGFFETSGFYTRNAPNNREMLGYFHVVLVAEDRVFDFDLREPLVLDIKNYIRLQFTPPDQRVVIFGVPYQAREQLKWWSVTRFEIDEFQRETHRATWKKKLSEYVDLDAVFQLRRGNSPASSLGSFLVEHSRPVNVTW